MNPNNDKIKMLADLLHTQTPEEVLAAYYGVAEMAVTMYMEQVGCDASQVVAKVGLRSLVSDIAEIAIVDRTLLENVFLAVYNFKYAKKPSSKELFDYRYDNKTFEDTIGLSQAFSLDVIATINKQYKIYREAMTATYLAFSGIASERTLGR